MTLNPAVDAKFVLIQNLSKTYMFTYFLSLISRYNAENITLEMYFFFLFGKVICTLCYFVFDSTTVVSQFAYLHFFFCILKHC